MLSSQSSHGTERAKRSPHYAARRRLPPVGLIRGCAVARPDRGAPALALGSMAYSLERNAPECTIFSPYRPADDRRSEVVSDGADGIACWFIDTDYNEESFFVRHAYFLGANDPYSALKTTLKAEIDKDAWGTLNSDTSRPFDKPKKGRIAVKVINHLGDEVMKVFKVA